MSYQVLARKWRPRQFSQLVGQEQAKTALINGLSNQRLHHAYLFTGTRGVGKTTIARIFSKSLNCEVGVTAEPCGQCASCKEVDEGRFVDLIEIDAASRTKVDDTREILDNVQYAPTRGRYKVYLIDEVHMLSRSSFNALLKTLEEPPEHVKFLLATTDPQKLPVTILSRCLQFNLHALSRAQISAQLDFILTQEAISFVPEAIDLIAKFAKGSMRDALSLTDQAIAQSNQNLTMVAIQQMMGTMETSWSQQLFVCLLEQDKAKLVSLFEQLSLQHPDIERLVDDLLTLCHQIAMAQVLPEAAQINEQHKQLILKLAEQLTPQEVQVYYQLLLQGKRDIKLCFDLTSGFEMLCLKLMAFTPEREFELSSLIDTNQNSREDINQEKSQNITEPATSNTTLKKNSETQLAKSEITPLPEPVAEPIAQVEELDAHLDAQKEPSVSESQQAVDPINVILALRGVKASSSPDIAAKTVIDPDVDLKIAEQSNEQPPVKPIIQLAPHSEIASNIGAEEQVTQQQADSRDAYAADNSLSSSLQSPPLQQKQLRYAHQIDHWAQIIHKSNLNGLTKQIALNSSLTESTAESTQGIELSISAEFAHLLNENTKAELTEFIQHWRPQTALSINILPSVTNTPMLIQQQIDTNRQTQAEQAIADDPVIQTLIADFDAQIVTNTIKPIDY